MEGSGKESSAVEKDVIGDATDVSTHDADLNIAKTTFTENDAMDTDNSCEETSVAESNLKSSALITTEKTHCDALLPKSQHDHDTSNDNCNVFKETNNECLTEGRNVSKAENANEVNKDRQPENYISSICNIAEEENTKTSEMNVHGVIGGSSSGSSEDQKSHEDVINEEKEVNGNTVANVTSNNDEENNVEAMITEDSLDSRSITNELNIETVTMANDAEKNSKPVTSDANNKNLDTSQKPKTVTEKDLNPLKLICDYGSDSDDNNENDCVIDAVISLNPSSVSKGTVVNPCPATTQEYRKPETITLSESEEESDSSEDESSSSSSTASSSSSSDESDDSDHSSENECAVVKEKKHAAELPKTKGELGLGDLPPIEDLHISVPESEAVEIGKVLSIVDSLVVVQSMQGCPALDLDSILFLDNGHSTLGHIFDVFGKVGEACYCVRFNSKDHALEKGIKVGMPVYYAPRTEHSKFVFLADLLKMKGSDASWEHNNEPPPKYLDFSDDEQERHARHKKPITRDVEPEETQPQNKKFQWRGPKRGAMGSEHTPRGNPDQYWKTPFNRYPCQSPSQTPSPRPGPQPLIRPPSFRASGPPPAHFYNTAAGASSAPPHLSPWAVPPPAIREDFNYNMNITNIRPPQPQVPQNQVRPCGFNMGIGSFGQTPPPPPPSPASRNLITPTSIPGTGPFLTSFTNAPRPNTPSPFTSFPPYHFGSSRQNVEAQGSFPPTDHVFMNHNVPPPRPPQGW